MDRTPSWNRFQSMAREEMCHSGWHLHLLCSRLHIHRKCHMWQNSNVRQIMKMFRRVVDPLEPGPAAEMAKAECRKRMRFSLWMIVGLAMFLIAGLTAVRIAPDLIGATGERVLGVVIALILVQGVDWIAGYQRMRRLTRLSESGTRMPV